MLEGLSLDDVLLTTRYSDIGSRFGGEIDLSVDLLPKLMIKYPIISANMDSVTGPDMAIEMARLGGLGILHRFMPINEHYEKLMLVPKGKRVACIGVGKGAATRASLIVPESDAVLVDVAHGHTKAVYETVDFLVKKYPDWPVIAGNVATYEGAMFLCHAGASSIKCGIGNGGLCETRIKTGCGVPQFTAIQECVRAINDWSDAHPSLHRPTLIADGGMKDSGDVFKALAAGADAIMTGSLLAGTQETPGKIINLPTGQSIKLYRGSASHDAQQDRGIINSSVEGVATLKPYKGPLKDVFQKIVAGVLSGMSYQGATTIEQLHKVAEFMRVTPAGYRESTSHGA